jgi:hypothetical protein
MEIFMRFVATAILALVAGTSCASSPAADADRPPALDCQSGPLHKTYGNSDWLVYGCSDSLSAVVVSDASNPAAPFYFILYVKPDGSMHLYGEGTGKKSATQAAFEELETLTTLDVASLVSQAKVVSTGDK